MNYFSDQWYPTVKEFIAVTILKLKNIALCLLIRKSNTPNKLTVNGSHFSGDNDTLLTKKYMIYCISDRQLDGARFKHESDNIPKGSTNLLVHQNIFTFAVFRSFLTLWLILKYFCLWLLLKKEVRISKPSSDRKISYSNCLYFFTVEHKTAKRTIANRIGKQNDATWKIVALFYMKKLYKAIISYGPYHMGHIIWPISYLSYGCGPILTLLLLKPKTVPLGFIMSILVEFSFSFT